MCVWWQCLQSNVIYNHFHLILWVAVACYFLLHDSDSGSFTSCSRVQHCYRTVSAATWLWCFCFGASSQLRVFANCCQFAQVILPQQFIVPALNSVWLIVVGGLTASFPFYTNLSICLNKMMSPKHDLWLTILWHISFSYNNSVRINVDFQQMVSLRNTRFQSI